MITEKEKDRRAKLCGYSEERYTDKVKGGVSEELGMKSPDETAILRKLCAKLLSDLSEVKMAVMGKEVSGEAVTDFIIYNANVEQIKVKAKEDIK